MLLWQGDESVLYAQHFVDPFGSLRQDFRTLPLHTGVLWARGRITAILTAAEQSSLKEHRDQPQSQKEILT